MRHKLIVNGDDFGRTESLTRGVIEAFKNGILTSATIVANSHHFDLAVELAKENPKLGVGVHLVLNEYDPITSPEKIPSLLKSDGKFLSRSTALLKIFSGQIPSTELQLEWEAQIQKVINAGIQPTHLDGHGHCHASLPLAKMMVSLAKKFNIGAVRMPVEPIMYRSKGSTWLRYLEKFLLFIICLPVAFKWRKNLKYPDAFFGFSDCGCLNVEALNNIAGSLTREISELVTHPALDNRDIPYGLDYNWRGDLDSLLAYTKEEFEARFQIELVSYRNAWDVK